MRQTLRSLKRPDKQHAVRTDGLATMESSTPGSLDKVAAHTGDPVEALALAILDHPAHPMHWSTFKKWIIIVIYCLLQLFIAMTSTSYVSVVYLIQERFGTSLQVTTLGQSLFIVGNAVGPLFLGPLSDIAGRKWVYVGSILLFSILNIGLALALNFPMMAIFMFLIGAAGSTALCNVAGSIADLYGDANNSGQAMALFVFTSGAGPSLGSPVGEWVALNPRMGLNWLFWLNVIIGGAFALGMIFVPETLPRVVIERADRKQNHALSKSTSAVLQIRNVSVVSEIRFVATTALRIFFTEPIVASFGIYNGFAYGLLFLYLTGVFPVFTENNGLSYIDASLTYLNFAVGAAVMFCIVPIQTWLYKRDKQRNGGTGRPEARLLLNLVTIWLFPGALFWFAFTSSGNVNYWSPIVAGAVAGTSNTMLYLSILTYLSDAYPSVIASAIAALLLPSFLIAAGLAHVGLVMFENLGTRTAFIILAGVSCGLVILTYTIYFFGPWLRRRSKLARVF
ncbi:MFS multidrug transporter-like protein [Protomyces lactucae-debilis]|uniref:MFS multidrug transporter-like protein n=1 Tax=Protomyces lactucae-debilis TaxID=2754530 RepID=A0A1Y2FQC5_PROLT|nr:MFS multidrug transporter-like protein [Protomyces lactucae-debilis]ORY85524.1 MFS multidrug transporter-like protein [Protomyces lactucae-debilis]